MSGNALFQVLDLDEVFPRAWVDAEGCRAFQFDAFLSHNRDDGSERLLSALSDRGVVAWHDGNADLRDRKVMDAVRRAIDASRTIVLCVGAGFRDSAWVQAEYVPALKLEETGRLTRVVIADLEPGGGTIPEALRRSPRFAWSQDQHLAEFLIGQNHLQFRPGPVATRADRQARTYQELCSSIGAVPSNFQPPAGSIIATLLRVLHEDFDTIATNAQGAEYYWLVAPAGWANREWSSAPPFDSLDGALLRELGLRAVASVSPDNRANGLRILIGCDRAWRQPASLTDVLDALRGERDATVSDLAAEWLAENVDRIARADPALLQLLALRSPALFRATKLMSVAAGFAEPVRCRILVDRPLGGLTRGVQLSLIEERLTFILEQAPAGAFTTDFGHVGPALRITDTELLVRELCKDVLGVVHSGTFRLSPDALDDIDLLRRALAIFERIVVHSQTHRGWPLLALDEWAFEFVVHPLCLYHQSPNLWPQAQVLLQATLGVLEQDPRRRAEVPCHRQFIERLAAGWPINKASRELFRCIPRTAGRTDP